MAIQEQTGPVAVTVFCDECGTERCADYLVPAGEDSLRVARDWMGKHAGWKITEAEDLCPKCSIGASEETYYCGAQTFAGRMYVDPEPAEYCETEVAEAGDRCPAHTEDDDRDEYEEWRERQMDERYGD
jgi:hypothetical protein